MLRRLYPMIFVSLLVPAPASAADIFDSWINVFNERSFTIENLEASHSRADQQLIKGTSNGRPLVFQIQRHRLGFANVENILTEESLSKRVGGSGLKNVKRIKVREGFGAAGEMTNGCTYSLVAIKGNPTSDSIDAHEFVMDAIGCGDAEKLIAFLGRAKPSSRELNVAEYNMFRGTSSQTPSTQKSKLQTECEAAQRDKAALASFMQGLPRDVLTKYLEAGQACTVFR